MLRRVQPHVPGLVYTVLLMLVGMAAMNNQNNLLFWVLGMLVAGVVVSAVVSALTLRFLRIRRIDPQHGAVGEPLIVRYAVQNRNRLLSMFNIQLEERIAVDASDRSSANGQPSAFAAGAWVMHVGPRELVHGEAIFWPTKRGRIAFDRIRVWTMFPFGIIRKSRIISQPQYTLIYPMLYELRRGLLSAITPRGLIGTKLSHHAGAGDDYYGTREYKPGDGMRHIAWKRAAKTDQLVTIERTSPSPAKLRIILDLTVPTEKLHIERNDAMLARELEEQAISLAASIVHAADMEGYEVGLTVLGLPQPPIAVRRNRWHFNKIMAALAGLDLNATRIAARPQPVRDAERAGLIVIAPDRTRPMQDRDDAWYLTARQLESLAVRPIGWDAARRGSTLNAPPVDQARLRRTARGEQSSRSGAAGAAA